MPGTGYVCQPTKMGNVCEAGRICEAPPATLPRGDWSVNARVPAPTTPIMSLFESEGNVAVDTHGHVAVSQIALYDAGQMSGSIMSAAVFDDNAGTFHSPVAYGEYPTTAYTSDPVVAYDNEIGTNPAPLYLVWLNIDLDSTGNASTLHTMVAKSLDNGATFGPPNAMNAADVHTLGQEVSAGMTVFDKPWIAASNNHVYVTYAGLANPDEVMVTSDDGGVTWSAPRAMNANTGVFNNFGQIAIAKDTGDVFVTWMQQSSAQSTPLVAARWKRFSAGAAWFEHEVAIPGSDNVANPSGNAVSHDGSHFWAVWDDGTADGSNIKASVAADATASTTLTFPAAPVTVNDDTGCGDHIHATVAVDGNGIGHVLWLDNRYSGDLVQGVVHYAKSTDSSGTAFTTPVVVSDTLFPFTTSRVPGLWLGDYVGIAVTANKVWAAWADPRVGPPNRTHFFLASRPLP